MFVTDQRKQAGDTIIEVMIVLAVLGLAIGLSYVTANRSLLNLRQAEENSAATGLVQSQIESLRYLSTVPSPDVAHNIFPNPAVPFCIDTSNNTVVRNPTPNAGPCYVDTRYNILINYVAGGGTDTFKVTVTWPDVRGDVDDVVTTYYRVHSL